MTVIAWDGKTLAADKQSSDEWVKRTVTKIRSIHDGSMLVGAAGSADRCRALMAWFESSDQFPEHLRTAESSEATLLVIHPDGSASMYQREPVPIYLEGPFQAIGSGADAAMAAMVCGKTAAEAIEIASQICRGVGNGVDTLTLRGQ